MVVSARKRAQQQCLQLRQRRAHPDQRGARSHHERVAEEPVFPGDQQLVRMFPHDGRNALKRHHGIERGDFDADDGGERQNPVQRLVVVVYAAGRFV